MDTSKTPDSLPPQPGFWSDLLGYARKTKKWWLIPVILVLVLVGLFILGASGAMPFIYTLF